ncbi:hypothetical protein [Streptomyces sp. NPDC087270]|uniref:hypothetical protein n=1 Tax=Streptomyces sp. NPDC087270 TaxID=3365774 RepID=UPI0038068520
MPSTSYSAVKVLGIPRLVLARGRIVAVVGENGVGKSARPPDAVEAGIGLVPEDRKVQSLLRPTRCGGAPGFPPRAGSAPGTCCGPRADKEHAAHRVQPCALGGFCYVG